MPQEQEIAVVAVFGDLGRSPRMMNHARELLKINYEVNIIGYRGGRTLIYNTFHDFLDIDRDILSSSKAKFHYVSPFNFDTIRNYLHFIDKYMKSLLIFFRIILLISSLIMILAKIFFLGKKTPKIMIIQVSSS